MQTTTDLLYSKLTCAKSNQHGFRHRYKSLISNCNSITNHQA